MGIIATAPGIISPGKATNAHTSGIIDDKFTSIPGWFGHLFDVRKAFRILDKGDKGCDEAVKK
ncbi:MAG: hypothetical protein CSA81_02060 [Acidobacteria bacterium]|nr:MAG: hypothetical protein CSA81_02060 [Acidobacteriota bacterium]